MTERTFRLVLEYDGAGFSGWQFQPELRTVQGELERALGVVLGEEIQVAGAGRTDSGVHAEGQVASFRTAADVDARRVARSLGGLVGPDLVVRRAEEVASGFHARHSARERVYRYRIALEPTAVHRRFAWYPKRRLDVGAMRVAAECLLGRHDMSSFAATSDDAPSKVCEVRIAALAPFSHGVELHLTADRFLHHMVRTIAGTLVEIGAGRIDPGSIATIRAARSRAAAGPTAPPHGLTLVSVAYAASDLTPDRGT